jgi:hypothetical protein
MAATAPFRFEIVKSYPRQGPLQQYRVAAATAFTCMRCLQAKTPKLVATVNADGSQLMCNGAAPTCCPFGTSAPAKMRTTSEATPYCAFSPQP